MNLVFYEFTCNLQDQKKIQDSLLTEKESIYGSKPSPRKNNSFKKSTGYSTHGNGSMTPMPRRSSVGSGIPDTPRSYSGRQNGYFRGMRGLSTAPLNFVAVSKEDVMSSYTSICGSEPDSPPQVWKPFDLLNGRLKSFFPSNLVKLTQCPSMIRLQQATPMI